jgi:hypothetical protein
VQMFKLVQHVQQVHSYHLLALANPVYQAAKNVHRKHNVTNVHLDTCHIIQVAIHVIYNAIIVYMLLIYV